MYWHTLVMHLSYPLVLVLQGVIEALRLGFQSAPFVASAATITLVFSFFDGMSDCFLVHDLLFFLHGTGGVNPFETISTSSETKKG